MKTVEGLYVRVRSLLVRYESVVKFMIVGGGATLVHMVAANVARFLYDAAPLTANIIGYCTGFFLSFFGHKFWSFAKTAQEEQGVHTFLKFGVVTAVGFGVNNGVFYVFCKMIPPLFGYAVAEEGGLWFNVSVASGCLVAAASSYCFNRFWAFK
ncbi:GtrA family protein [Akkermansia glycaniphila]|uniref:Gtra-like protein n=1 Tax=Akkermansia glycaniphila TaxID=1679444 RepID=A0A1C7P8U8_9BACT|nr:GtrA family protein [Akkermansia glycaniphila]OCA02001.1 hypothetical protein AC781_12450 [Akkermansia glycaniphila]SEH93096.1 gtra-like protein [Akkermansia glycaniphila]